MNLYELIRLAISRLAAARLRAVLTMLGVVIGVASVVALVSVGQGATSGITDRLAGLGTNLLTVTPGANVSGFTRGAAGSATTLTLDDASAISTLSGVAAVAPQSSTQALVVAGTNNTTTTIVGTTAAYAAVNNFEIWQGSFLTAAGQDNHLHQAVLGATTASDLNLGADSIGSSISIAGRPYQLIGILQAKGSSGLANADDQVLIPLSTLRRDLVAGSSVRSIGLSVSDAAQIDTVEAAITSTLDQRHHISASGTPDFSITSQAQLLSTVSSVTAFLTILLAGIASISLLVGGIGIMNIMLVSVRERTREIGIRKAIGARRRDILAQFLVEALVISTLGGLVGVIAGTMISALIANIGGWSFVFSPLTVLAAVGFSLAVGVIFGVWPARSAAGLDPIAALRYE
jgi:putative ABC transport system permease protein